MKSVYLIGFMGSGKSTIGKKIAKKLNLELFDTDNEIEKNQMKRISDIFDQEGEAQFRQYERDTLFSMPKDDAVISTGGGIIELKENRDYLIGKKVVYLKTDYDTIVKRLKDDESRPIWQDESRDKKELWNKRDHLYKEVASEVIETDQLTINEVLKRIESTVE